MERSTMEDPPRATDRRSTTIRSDRADDEVRRTARRRIPRSRGAVCGLLLALLGIWGGLIAFVGPYFNYEFGSDEAWLIDWDRFWLNVLPAGALFIGGLALLASRSRMSGVFGAWLALAGGIWFVVGPTVSMLWDSSLDPSAPIGQPIGSTGVQVLELLGYFYALGAAATALAALALGRLSIVAHRDIELARERAPVRREPEPPVAERETAPAEPRAEDRARTEADSEPTRKPLLRRIFSRRE